MRKREVLTVHEFSVLSFNPFLDERELLRLDGPLQKNTPQLCLEEFQNYAMKQNAHSQSGY